MLAGGGDTSYQALDTFEDMVLMARRQVAELASESELEDADQGGPPATVGFDDTLNLWRSDDPRPRVLVLGSGWGAHAFIKVHRCEMKCVTETPLC